MMSSFVENEQLLTDILKKKLSPEFYEYAITHLKDFYDKCYGAWDERAAYTDREGQPRLIRYDKMGNDVSKVWVNEGYKQTVKEAYDTGIAAYPHKEIPELKQKGNYVYSFAQGYLLSQTEAGFYCPVTLTMATAYLLDHYADQELKDHFLPHVLSTGEVELYEGATFLTERQGGSDVGANVVKAVKEDGVYRLFGEKYFASNAGQAGVATVLARMEGAPEGTRGLSLFLVPWRNQDGELNQITIRRLKDKLGVRAVPSGEVEFNGSEAYPIGEADRGFYYMMEALNLSRICNSVASLGIMKRALKEGFAYVSERDAFGQKLIDFPMMQETVVQLQVRHEVQLSALFESIELFERVVRDDVHVTLDDIALNRLYIALIKSRTAKESIDFAHAAIEMHGGNGYIEDFVTPRLLRDAQVLTVWEGTENILALEVLRLVKKFNVHEVFIRDLKRRLGSKKMRMIDVKIEELESILIRLTALSENHQTYYARKVASRMADLLFVVHAYERADDERSLAVADIYRDWL